MGEVVVLFVRAEVLDEEDGSGELVGGEFRGAILFF